MFVLYNLVITLLAPFWVPYTLIRAMRRKERPRWAERVGNFRSVPQKGEKQRVWIHAVSVGEVFACAPIVKEIRRLLPNHEVLLSVTTSSGHAAATGLEGGLFDFIVYFPMEVPRFQWSAMLRVKPSVVAVMETELWLDFFWAAKAVGACTLVLNGRLSDRGFARYSRVKPLTRAILCQVDRCLMQGKVDADRIQALGASGAEVMGNCKFDVAASETNPQKWNKELGLSDGRFTLVVGSTRSEDEERLVVDAVAKVGIEKLQVIHAPRHLETADRLAQRVAARFGSVARRSQRQSGDYLVLDSYGELADVYSVADAVVIGGGFSKLGGQNILQPLALGKPVIHGPHMFNFRDAANAADEAGAALAVSTADGLAAAILELMGDDARREAMGRAGLRLISANRGASLRYAQAVAEAASGTIR